MERISSMFHESFEVVEEPTEEQLGQFRVRIEPHCGMDVAGCSVLLLASYMQLDNQELFYEIVPDEVVGLTDEQVDELNYSI